jgi:hypothetical protein
VRTVLGMLRPWAMCLNTLTGSSTSPDTTFAAPMDNKWGICGTSSSGNWGSVDYDGGGNPATALVNWTRYGYQGPMPTVPGTLLADPGVSASQLGTAFSAIVNTTILLPVASNYVDPLGGNNGTFQTQKLALVRFCGAYYQNRTYATDSSGVASTCWVNPVPQTSSTTTTTTFTATGGAMAKGSAVLTVTSPSPFFTDPTWLNSNPNIVVTVTVPGAAGGGKDLVAKMTSFTNGTTAVLDTKATTAVSGKTITVTVATTTTTTTTPPAPLDPRGNVYNQLQFRWLRTYNTSAEAAVPCDLNDTLCHGVVQLYK